MSGRKFDGNPQNLQRGMPGLIPGMAAPTVMPGMASNLPGQRTVQTGHRPQSLDEVRNARTLNGKPIGLVPDFITQEERAKLHAFARDPNTAYETYLDTSDVWYDRMINPRTMPPGILKLMERIRKRTVAHIKTDYGIDEPIYSDTLQLVRWRPGDNQAAHADCEEPDGRPNRTPWRAFASIIYLNDEYTGGGIHFPKLGFTPEIAPRMLAYFPSTASYLHGVKPVISGMRYTMSCFYTFDPRRHDGHAV